MQLAINTTYSKGKTVFISNIWYNTHKMQPLRKRRKFIGVYLWYNKPFGYKLCWLVSILKIHKDKTHLFSTDALIQNKNTSQKSLKMKLSPGCSGTDQTDQRRISCRKHIQSIDCTNHNTSRSPVKAKSEHPCHACHTRTPVSLCL